jgi:hypothetical protein
MVIAGLMLPMVQLAETDGTFPVYMTPEQSTTRTSVRTRFATTSLATMSELVRGW